MQGDRNPVAQMLRAHEARKLTDEARGEARRIARRMAETLCQTVIVGRIRSQAETGGDAQASVILPASRLMREIWDEPYPPEWWPEREADRLSWGVMADADGSAYEDEGQPWHRPGSPYRLMLEELERMLVEAGYRAHAAMEVRSGDTTREDGTVYVLRVTVGW